MTTDPRHFLDLSQVGAAPLRAMIDNAGAMKGDAGHARPLAGKALAMIFEKPSTRTRVSFDLAMRQLGGETIVLSAADMQLGRGETISDTAKVLSRYVDAIMIRANNHADLLELAESATVPVINGLSDRSHPCQLMADIMTLEEHRGAIAGQIVAWTGDGNNVAHSWIEAAARFDFELRLACPRELEPSTEIIDWARQHGAAVQVMDDPEAAVAGADCVVADTWISMGDALDGSRHNLLKPYQVTEQLMNHAKTDALFMHCLPAHRGEEVTAQVIDGPNSVVFDEAENRLHAQKAVLAWCFGAGE